jgi:hypothetical protein
VIEARFHNPYGESDGDWYAGFYFRFTSEEDYYLVMLGSQGDWLLYEGPEEDEDDSGSFDPNALDLSRGGSNRIGLVVDGGQALIFVNGRFVAELDISDHTDSGNIGITSWLYPDEGTDTVESTRVDRFTVRSLDAAVPSAQTATAEAQAEATRVQATAEAFLATAEASIINLAYGPSDGELPSVDDGQPEWIYTGQYLQRFIVGATFVNPHDGSDGTWSYGFFLRESSIATAFRVMVASDNHLYLFRGSEVEPILVNPLSNFDTDSGASNKVVVVVLADALYVYVNDIYVGGHTGISDAEPGDVAIGSEFLVGDVEAEGVITRYVDFYVAVLP